MIIRKAFRFTVYESIPLVAALWILSFIVFWAIRTPHKALALNINIFETVFGFFTGGFLLVASARVKEKQPRTALLGTALAVLSWTLGQVFWFSYTNITGEEIPYPSVGDLGYTGTYFFLIGVIGVLLREQPAVKRKWYSYGVFLLLIFVPLALLFIGNDKPMGYIYNFVLTAVLCTTIFQNLRLTQNRRYRWFMCGVFLLGLADIAFMISISLFPDSHLYESDMLYVASLALISYGMLKGD